MFRNRCVAFAGSLVMAVGLYLVGDGDRMVLAQGNPPPGGPATITEYSIPAGLGLAHGVAKEEGTTASGQGNRNVWFSVLSGDAVVKLDPQTGIETAYVIPGGPHFGITDLRLTPDGDVWFNTGSGKLGTLDPRTGSGTLYLTGLGFLDWIVVDHQRNVWSTVLGGASVVVLDPKTGVATMYPTGAGPTGLARRRSGDVWWCERSTGMIGRLDLRKSVITHYPTPFSAIEGCAVDPMGEPEGLVWVTPGFAGAPAGAVGSLNPKAGMFTLYATPTLASQPYGISIGCAGSVVFGEDMNFFPGVPHQIGVLVPSLATGVGSPSVGVSAPVVPVTFTPAAVPFVVAPTTSVAAMTSGTSTPLIAGGFSEYPTLSSGGEAPHLVVIGPNEKVVYSHFNTSTGDKVGILELPPAARCRQQ